jgi:hypothetical protein
MSEKNKVVLKYATAASIFLMTFIPFCMIVVMSNDSVSGIMAGLSGVFFVASVRGLVKVLIME